MVIQMSKITVGEDFKINLNPAVVQWPLDVRNNLTLQTFSGETLSPLPRMEDRHVDFDWITAVFNCDWIGCD